MSSFQGLPSHLCWGCTGAHSGDFEPWEKSSELFASWYDRPSLPDPRLQANNWIIKNWPLSSPPGYDVWEELNPDRQQVQDRICQSLAANKLFREDLMQGQIL